jgi:hypothetical protein
MNVFQRIFLILSKKYNFNKKNSNNILLFNFYFSMQLINNFTIKDKFKFFKIHILNNKLLTLSEKEKGIYVFSISQKYYFLLSNFLFKYKCKKANFYNNLYDLNYNLLTNLSNNIKIIIYDNKNNLKYNFRISDIINIINSSLCYMDNFYFSVNDIKNPYTNLPFNLSTLYNIYFSIKSSSFLMPKFFHLYFLSNFDKENFYKLNECLIKTYTLNNYIKNINNNEKIVIIKNMLNELKNGISIIYNREIYNNDKELLNIFGSCIKDYIFMNHSNNVLLIFEAKENLKNKIILISTQNILSQLNINININNITNEIANYMRPHWRRDNNISLNNFTIQNNMENNIENNGNINHNIRRIFNNRQINNTNNVVIRNINKIFNNFNNIYRNYPIFYNTLFTCIISFRVYLLYKFLHFLYIEFKKTLYT